MPALVIGLRLREVAFRVLHKGGLSFLIAEAVSLALDRRIDRAIRGGVFAHGGTLGAHVIKLTFRSCDGCRGETKHQSARDGGRDVAPTHDSAPFGVPLVIYSPPSRSES